MSFGHLALPGLDGSAVGLVTGGSGGIGSAVTGQLLAMGVTVGVLSRAKDRLEAFATELSHPPNLRLLPGDVTDEDDVSAAVNRLVDELGRLDFLVNLAAVADGGATIRTIDARRARRVLDVNVVGTLLPCQAAAAHMIPRGRGRIVTVASAAATRAREQGTIYGPSKAAVVRLTAQLAVELGPHGITVNCVSPGQTPTALRDVGAQPGAAPTAAGGTADTTAERNPRRRRGRMSDYVGPILFFCSDLADYTNGVNLDVDGGAHVRR